MTTAVTQSSPRIPTGVAANARHAVLWLAHPVTVVAFIVLALNDHVFKAAYGTWWTGKLSDAAGMAAFPALLALAFSWVAPRVSPPARIAAAVITTGVGFVWVKATAVGAATASSALSVAVPSLVRQDATDLLALPFLVLAGWIGMRVAAVAPAARARLQWLLVVPAVVVCAATSAEVEDEGARGFFVIEGTVYATVGTYPMQYAVVHADGTWELLTQGASEQIAGASREGVPTCTTRAPVLCFRAHPQGMGVDVSRDHGTTWTADWTMSAFEQQYLVDNIDTSYTSMRTYGVAVVESESHVTVVAANGVDGFAIRNADGTWERVGFTPVFDTAAARPVEIPEPAATRLTYHLPMTFVWLAPVMAAALPVTAGALRIRARRLHGGSRLPWGAWLGAGVLTAGAVTLSALAIPVARDTSTYGPDNVDAFTSLVLQMAIAVWFAAVLAMVVGAVAIVAHRRRLMIDLAFGTWGAATILAVLINPLWSEAFLVNSVAMAVAGVVLATALLTARNKIKKHTTTERTMKG